MFYYLIRRKELNCLLKKFDNIIQNVIDSNFVTNSNEKYILNTAKQLKYYIKYYLMVKDLLIVCPVIITYVLHYLRRRVFFCLDFPTVCNRNLCSILKCFWIFRRGSVHVTRRCVPGV